MRALNFLKVPASVRQGPLQLVSLQQQTVTCYSSVWKVMTCSHVSLSVLKADGLVH